MNRFLLSGAALILWGGVAGAADLPTKAPALPPPPPAYDWTGFYIGGFYATTVTETKAHTDPPYTGGASTGVAGIAAGGLGLGGTLGYNWQVAPTWLIGVEGEFGTLGVDRTFQDWADPVLVGTKADWYATVRGRFGYVTGPSLLYVTGGAAFVDIRDTFGGGSSPNLAVPPAAAITNTTTSTGWVVGGGIETKLSRNWSATTEYLYIDAGSVTFASNPFSVAGAPTTFDHTYHVLKTGLNYKLDGNWEGLPLFGAAMLPSNHAWDGFYAGLNVGGGMSLVHAFDVGVTPGGEEEVNGTGLAGGGQVGYNYMLGRRWFVGVEGDIGYLGIRGSVNDWNAPIATFQTDTNWYATARARFGGSTGPALLYFTAGGAWVNLKDGFAPTFIGPVNFTGDLASRTAGGWTIGGGTEVALDSHWSARLETLYIDVGHQEHQLLPAVAFADFKDRFVVVRAGLNFQFGGADLVTTKY
jgi:outer membrane immunogenic protein